MKTIAEVRKELESRVDRSAWGRGVNVYSLELLEELEENRRFNNADEHLHPLEIKSELLNGAKDWREWKISDTKRGERQSNHSKHRRSSDHHPCRQSEQETYSRWTRCCTE